MVDKKNSESSRKKGDDSLLSKGRSLKAANKWQSNRSIFVDLLQFFLLMTFLFWVGWRGVDAMEYRWQWYRVPNFFYKQTVLLFTLFLSFLIIIIPNEPMRIDFITRKVVADNF